VGRSTQLKGSKVILHTILRHASGSHVGAELIDVVDTLTTGADLLASNEDIKRSSPLGIFRVLGSVEGASVGRELVEDVVVCAVLLAHKLAKSHLVGSRQILLFDVTSIVTEHLDTFAEGDDGGLL